MSETQAQPETLDAQIRLRVVICTSCDCIYALPLSLYLRIASDGGSLHCPHGHLNEARSEPPEQILQQRHALLEEVVTLRTQVATAERELTALRRFAPAPDEKEVKRRCELLVHRAKRANFGRPLCRFCGREQASNARLKDHLRRTHRAEVAELPAREFEL